MSNTSAAVVARPSPQACGPSAALPRPSLPGVPQVSRTASATSSSSATPSLNAESVAESVSSTATTVVSPGSASGSVASFFLGKKMHSVLSSSSSSVALEASVPAAEATPGPVAIDDSRSRRLKNSIKKTVSAMGSPPTTQYDMERGQSSKRLGVSPMGCSIQSHV
ncbi:hypothetical protein BROUX41_004949 [Berkeleyomyces rouxiae]|uniref:uncharacterized protein n=1 Tax=Berkeleyomyces rouxiae TaxID=2035830 RepID=UPI003B7B3610